MQAIDRAVRHSPALLVASNGDLLASDTAAALLGFSPRHLEELDRRFDVLDERGDSLPAEKKPWRMAAAGEEFESHAVWRDREGRRTPIAARARAVPGHVLLELERRGEAEARSHAQLRALNDALLARSPGGSAVSIREVLLDVVRLARDLTGARYAALATLRRDGTMRDFIHDGIDEETASRIAHLPLGKGLLGAAMGEARTIRVPEIPGDSRAGGFPPGHPPMMRLLATPLRLGAEVFGHFFVADKRGGGEFTDEDARLLERFSEQAALTVSYARHAEEEERYLFEAVVRNAPYGIVYFPADPRGDILGNPAAEWMLGRLTRGNDSERSFDVRGSDGRLLTDDELPSTRALLGEAVINREVTIERRDGRMTPALVSAAAVDSESGARIGAVVICQDITALKQLEQLREDFLAIVAHDLRTPLQSVLLQIEALLRRATGDAAAVPVTTLRTMRQNGRRIDLLIRDLLDASRIDSNGVVLERVDVHLPEAISSLLAQIGTTLGDHAVGLKVLGAPQAVWADPLRLDQILTNLLENAAKYSRPGSPIEISVANDADGATISIQDHGPGIAPDELPHLFDRYFQAVRARSKQHGLGLGLYIARGLIEAHGGRIHAESAVGTGTRFHVWLPAARGEQRSSATSPSRGAESAP